MPRKNLILTIVIVVLFGASAFIVYRGFFAGSTPVPSPAAITPGINATPLSTPAPGAVSDTAIPTTSPAGGDKDSTGTAPAPASVTSGKILPLGGTFDIGLVKKYNPSGQLFNYPSVNNPDVGPALNDIVKIDQSTKP